MVLLGFSFILFAVIGLMASTFASSGLAWFFFRLSLYSGDEDNPIPEESVPILLDILIPAYNEEKQILQTLNSLADERARFLSISPARIRIWVGADHCTDGTEQFALRWAQESALPVRVVRNPNAPGKWNMLQHLVSRSDADWVALVDVGAAWEPGLLTEASPHLSSGQVSGVAPSYLPEKAGALDRLTWGIERLLKTLEARAGGPVSVHGSTVLYRRAPLLKAYEALKRERPRHEWLNDDVVLPLMLRILEPEQRIVYLSGKNGKAWVRDYGFSPKGNAEPARRRRILIGNLQWMKVLYGRAVASSAVVGLIATRRVFRAFWAYWFLFGMTGLLLLFVVQVNLPTVASLLVFLGIASLTRLRLRGSVERLRAAFWAGLELPLYWFTPEKVSSEKIWS